MTFKPNAAGFDSFVAAVKGAEQDWAERIAQHARDNAPVRTGTYRDGIRVERDGDSVGVLASAPYSLWVEFGTADTPAFAPLTRGIDESGAEILPLLSGRGIEARWG